MNKKAFIFPGQGAQVVGMGKDFYDVFAIARETFEEASDVLSINMKEIIFQGPLDVLSQTKISQPAIFITSVAILKAVRKEFPDLHPALCAGLSLGEYTALFAAGKISFSDCLKLVASRGAYMQEACGERAGTMRVVLGLDPSIVKDNLPADVWIANLNCPGQVVIAGATSAIPAVEETLKAKGAKRVLPLEVSGAFHTPFMRSAQLKLEPMLKSVHLNENPTDIVMNVPGDFAKSLPEIRSNLIDQVASPTKWEMCVRKMEESGVELYVEMGPGKTLAGMNRKIGVKAPTLSIEKVTDLETLNATAGK
jgi:[acyl-carrier-protein] S-malonyltransferase